MYKKRDKQAMKLKGYDKRMLSLVIMVLDAIPIVLANIFNQC